MEELRSCVSPLSGEHLISKSVMEVLQGDAGFTVSGLPWLNVGEERAVGINSLTAKCLCMKHNSALSPLDAAARFFFASLKTFFEHDPGNPRHALVSGHDVERWLLKSAKAMAVSGNISRGQERLSGRFSQDHALIEMLDDPNSWPPGAGLYGVMSQGDLMVNHSRFQMTPWINDHEQIVGLQVSFLGLVFVLLLDTPTEELSLLLTDARFRPGRISVRHPTSHAWLTLSWQDGRSHDELTVQHVQSLPAQAGKKVP